MKKELIMKEMERILESVSKIADLVEEVEKGFSSAPTKKEKTGVEDFTEEDLKKMKISELKKLGAELGVKCVGTRDEITKSILEMQGEKEEVLEEVEEEIEETPKKKRGRPRKEEEVEEEEEIDEDDDDELEEDDGETDDEEVDYEEMATSILADQTFEEVKEALEEAGIEKVTKKNVKTKLVEALEQGLIETEEEEDEDFDEEDIDDENESSDEEYEDEEDGEELDKKDWYKEYDLDKINNPKAMTKERKQAVIDLVEDIITSYKENNLTDEEIDEFIEKYATKEELKLAKKLDETEKLKLYIEMQKRRVDGEGELHSEDEEPYEIDEDTSMCCGNVLKFVKKTGSYICEKCGGEYEAE